MIIMMGRCWARAVWVTTVAISSQGPQPRPPQGSLWFKIRINTSNIVGSRATCITSSTWQPLRWQVVRDLLPNFKALTMRMTSQPCLQEVIITVKLQDSTVIGEVKWNRWQVDPSWTTTTTLARQLQPSTITITSRERPWRTSFYRSLLHPTWRPCLTYLELHNTNPNWMRATWAAALTSEMRVHTTQTSMTNQEHLLLR